MFNIFQLLIALLIIFQFQAGKAFSGTVTGTISAIVGAVLLTGGLAHIFVSFVIDAHQRARMHAQQMETQGIFTPDQVQSALSALRRKMVKAATRVTLMLDLAVLGTLYLLFSRFDVSGLVAHVLHIPEGLSYLPLMLPFLLMMCAVWTALARVQRSLRGGDWRIAGYTLFQLRMTVFGILPLITIGFLRWGVEAAFPEAGLLRQSFKFLELGFVILALLFITTFLPVVMRLILNARRFPGGELRDRLEAVGKRAGVPIGRLFIWRTGRAALPTAFYVGLIRPFRYIFITDALLKILDQEEIEAVYAHELGHAKHRHLWLLLTAFIGFTLLILVLSAYVMPYLGGEVMSARLEDSGSLASVLFILAPMMIGYFYFGIGYLSRRFERQADFFAAGQVGPLQIASALDNLAHAAGGIHFKRGWRHFSIARRMRELSLLTLPEEEARKKVLRGFRREHQISVGVLMLLVVSSLVLLEPLVEDDVRTGLGTYAYLQAMDYNEGGDLDRAREMYGEAAQHMRNYLAWPSSDGAIDYEVAQQAAIAETLAYGDTDLFARTRELICAKSWSQADIAARLKVVDEIEKLAHLAYKHGIAFGVASRAYSRDEEPGEE